MQNKNVLNASLMQYEDADEDAVYAAKNGIFCSRVNAGEKVEIHSQYDDLAYYALVVLHDGTALPLPLFCEAAGYDGTDWGVATFWTDAGLTFVGDPLRAWMKANNVQVFDPRDGAVAK